MRVRVAKFWTVGMAHPDGPKVLAIDDGRIRAVESASDGYDITLDCTAMPGLVDAHDHVGSDVGDELEQSRESREQNLLRGVHNLRRSVEAGVTTIRNCGERPGTEALWKEALSNGTLSGPRLVGAGSFLCRTGGHSWYSALEIDGADDIRRAVRANLRDGADFIKVAASGGMATMGSDPGAAEFTFEELQALVDEAHRLGMTVAAHAYGGTGADDAIAAGVDTIEHGSLLTDEQLQRLAQRDVPIVVTSTIIPAFIADETIGTEIRDKMRPFADSAMNVVRRARELGVTIGVGTDGVHGNVVGELETLVAAGYSLPDALVVATQTNARITGGESSGEIVPGAVADLLFLDGDPTEELSALRRPIAVMVAGHWVVPPVNQQFRLADVDGITG